jgi:dCTP deaminase
MTLLVDHEIRRLAQRGMLKDFAEEQYAQLPISAGVSTVGYDARLSPVAYVVKDVIMEDDLTRIVDPASFSTHPLPLERAKLHQFDAEEAKTHPLGHQSYFLLEGFGFMLGHTVETFDMPHNVAAVCNGKSTYARCGIHVNVTPIEPGWAGQVTLEIHNHTPYSVRIYPWRGICQFQFTRTAQPELTYDAKKGKYQGQMGVTVARP